MPANGGPVAQRLEQSAHNALVAGSNPAGPTNFPLRHRIEKKGPRPFIFIVKNILGGQHY
jgi:hypothetical protein